jgi:hypothetical protein
MLRRSKKPPSAFISLKQKTVRLEMEKKTRRKQTLPETLLAKKFI